MNDDTQTKLAEADGWTKVCCINDPDSHYSDDYLHSHTLGGCDYWWAHPKHYGHKLPDYSDFNLLFALIEKTVAKVEGYSISVEMSNYPDEELATVGFSNYDGLVQAWDSKTIDEIREHVAEAILKASE